MFAAQVRAAGQEETFEPGTGKYLLVLIDGSTDVVDRKTGKKAKEPDVAKHGGKVLSKSDRMRVIKLPVAAANALRKEENIAYMQRVWLGESLENWDPQEAASSGAADFELESQETDLTWSTGQFLYDGSGNVKKIGNDTYSYDSAGRLIQAVVNGVTETYKYDSFGNLTEKTIGATPGLVRVDSSSNRLVGETYDAAGNVTTHDGAPRYSYDSLNMMDQVAVGVGSTRRMLYGPDEERIAVIHDENLMRWTFRDFDGRILREYRGDCCLWEWLEDYVHGEGRLLAGQREQFFRGKRHFHTDHLGTIRLITDQNRRSISRHDFLPFGVEQTDPHYERQSSLMAGDYRARTDPTKYTAHEREFLGWYNYPNTDYLDYMHARMYDPNEGRFLSPDPVLGNLMRPQSWNRYAYVLNNPGNLVDPNGRVSCDPDVKDPSSDDCEQVEAPDPYKGRRSGTFLADGMRELENSAPIRDLKNLQYFSWRDILMFNARRQTPCKSYWERVGDNFVTTNTAIPGALAPLGFGLFTGKAVANAAGLPSFSQVLAARGASITISGTTFGPVEAVGAARAGMALNFLYVGMAYEGGVLIGSLAYAAGSDGCN